MKRTKNQEKSAWDLGKYKLWGFSAQTLNSGAPEDWFGAVSLEYLATYKEPNYHHKGDNNLPKNGDFKSWEVLS